MQQATYLLSVAPGGQPYYYNALTKESTYVRPLPAAPFAPGMAITPQAAFAAAKAAAQQPEKRAKEKPKTKTPIPGTAWLRVVTTAGNVFFTNKEKKESVWTVPEEIKEAVAKLEDEEKEKEEEEKRRTAEEEDKKRIAREAEVERVKRDLKEGKQPKRKTMDDVQPVDELEVSIKKARVDEEEDEGSEEDSDDEMEEWQREAAAQLAAEAEEEERIRREEEERRKAEEEEELRRKEKEKGMPSLNMPARVELSLDEAKALFKVCTNFFTLESNLTCKYRRCCVKSKSTLFYPGTLRCLNLFPILATSFYQV